MAQGQCVFTKRREAFVNDAEDLRMQREQLLQEMEFASEGTPPTVLSSAALVYQGFEKFHVLDHDTKFRNRRKARDAVMQL